MFNVITAELKLRPRKYNPMNNTFLIQLLRLFVSRPSNIDDNQVPISRYRNIIILSHATGRVIKWLYSDYR